MARRPRSSGEGAAATKGTAGCFAGLLSNFFLSLLADFDASDVEISDFNFMGASAVYFLTLMQTAEQSLRVVANLDLPSKAILTA